MPRASRNVNRLLNCRRYVASGIRAADTTSGVLQAERQTAITRFRVPGSRFGFIGSFDTALPFAGRRLAQPDFVQMPSCTHDAPALSCAQKQKWKLMRLSAAFSVVLLLSSTNLFAQEELREQPKRAELAEASDHVPLEEQT